MYIGREWYTACPAGNVTLLISTPDSWTVGGMTPDCRMQGTLPHHGNLRASQHCPDVTLFCKDARQAKPLSLIIATSRVLPSSYPPFFRANTSFSYIRIKVSAGSLQGTYTTLRIVATVAWGDSNLALPSIPHLAKGLVRAVMLPHRITLWLSMLHSTVRRRTRSQQKMLCKCGKLSPLTSIISAVRVHQKSRFSSTTDTARS